MVSSTWRAESRLSELHLGNLFSTNTWTVDLIWSAYIASLLYTLYRPHPRMGRLAGSLEDGSYGLRKIKTTLVFVIDFSLWGLASNA